MNSKVLECTIAILFVLQSIRWFFKPISHILYSLLQSKSRLDWLLRFWCRPSNQEAVSQVACFLYPRSTAAIHNFWNWQNPAGQWRCNCLRYYGSTWIENCDCRNFVIMAFKKTHILSFFDDQIIPCWVSKRAIVQVFESVLESPFEAQKLRHFESLASFLNIVWEFLYARFSYYHI